MGKAKAICAFFLPVMYNVGLGEKMKIKVLLAVFMIASSTLAQMRTYTFENATIEVVLQCYAEATGKRIDLVKGDLQPITLAASNVSTEFMLEQIEIALKKRNLKLYEISEDHLIASWIKVPEKHGKSNKVTKKRRFGSKPRTEKNKSNH